MNAEQHYKLAWHYHNRAIKEAWNPYQRSGDAEALFTKADHHFQQTARKNPTMRSLAQRMIGS